MTFCGPSKGSVPRPGARVRAVCFDRDPMNGADKLMDSFTAPILYYGD